MIPKKIHYIWLGNSEMPILENMCVLSWHDKLKGYEIKKWNEENLKINEYRKRSAFFNECYEKKIWAFVSDYLRFQILYEEGGIYLDTDVQTLKKFDNLLNEDVFVGKEKKLGNIGAGIIGCTPHNEYIKKIIDFYDNEIMTTKLYTSPDVMEYIYNKYNFNGIKILNYDLFYPYGIDENFNQKFINENTYTIHWYKPTWNTNKYIYTFLQTKHIKNPMIKKLMYIYKFLRFKQISYQKKHEKKKKNINTVGIITLYGNNNYGNKLQNYALQKIIEKYGFNTFTYKVNDYSKQYLKNKIYSLKQSIKIAIKKFVPGYKCYNKRYKAFIKFNKKYIKYSKNTLYNSNINIRKPPKYIIYGSDQIWNPTFNNDIELYLGKNAQTNKIAYAASFGIQKLNSDVKDVYKALLKNYKCISVRENCGKKIIDNLYQKDSNTEVLIDPTMLLTEKEWNAIVKKPNNLTNKKYILNYFLGELSDEKNKEIKKIAKENNCEIINVLDKNDKRYESGPSEFLYLEKNAFLICTDSFHACVFAIIFDKPFIVFEREQQGIKNMNSRIDTLIDKFKLKNRKYNGEIKKENLEHDYTECYKILKQEQEKANSFLKNALEIE